MRAESFWENSKVHGHGLEREHEHEHKTGSSHTADESHFIIGPIRLCRCEFTVPNLPLFATIRGRRRIEWLQV